MAVIQDWTDYNESLLFQTNTDYYKNLGKDAFTRADKEGTHIVPNNITNSYPHAKSIANIIKANLRNYPPEEKITILEAGTGTGIFARYLLIACRKLGILNRVRYLISDYSKLSLEQIKKSNILDGFTEGKNYELIELDLLNLDQAKDISGESYKLENLSLVIFNYIFCVLPLTILKLSEGDHEFEEMQLKFSSKDNKDVTDSSFLESLKVEQRWVDYDIEKQSKLEQEYKDLLIRQIIRTQDGSEYSFYAYSSLAVIDKLLDICHKDAFIFIADMPRIQNPLNPYKIYGNSIAHPINDSLIAHLCEEKGYGTFGNITESHSLLRMIIYKNSQSEDLFRESFIKEYIEKNETNLCLELRNVLNNIQSKHSAEVMKVLVDELLRIDPHSYQSYFFLARYYKILEDREKALENYKKAVDLDFLNNQNLKGMDLEELV